MTPEKRLDRYSVLFRFTTEEEIDIKALADQWGVEKMGVAGMLHGAKKSKKLYEDLRRKGYADDEFPDWWYSPARDKTSSVQSKIVPSSSEGIREVPPSSVKITFDPTPPRTPAPGEGGPGRPPIQDISEHDTSELDETRQDTSGLDQNEINLLGSRGIIRGQDGVWVRARGFPNYNIWGVKQNSKLMIKITCARATNKKNPKRTERQFARTHSPLDEKYEFFS